MTFPRLDLLLHFLFKINIIIHNNPLGECYSLCNTYLLENTVNSSKNSSWRHGSIYNTLLSKVGWLINDQPKSILTFK